VVLLWPSALLVVHGFYVFDFTSLLGRDDKQIAGWGVHSNKRLGVICLLLTVLSGGVFVGCPSEGHNPLSHKVKTYINTHKHTNTQL
jgi:hypothetical protein